MPGRGRRGPCAAAVGKLSRHARQLTLHLPADWPWAAAIAKAFKRLAALPA
jgi:hypothetical protein